MEKDGWNGARNYLGIVPQSNANMIRLSPKTNLTQEKPHASSAGRRIADALILIPTAAMLAIVFYHSTQIKPTARSIEKTFSEIRTIEPSYNSHTQTNSLNRKLESSVLYLPSAKETTSSLYKSSQTLNFKQGEYFIRWNRQQRLSVH